MPQWEYCEIHISELPRKTNVPNDASTNGRDLVVIPVNNVAYLKRLVAGAAPSPPHKTDAG